jgi:hypothetical protein
MQAPLLVADCRCGFQAAGWRSARRQVVRHPFTESLTERSITNREELQLRRWTTFTPERAPTRRRPRGKSVGSPGWRRGIRSARASRPRADRGVWGAKIRCALREITDLQAGR